MSQSDIRKALQAQLDAITPALPTAWENLPFQPPAPSSPYQVAYIKFATPDNPEMGSGYRELGYMQVDLMYPEGAGPSTAAARAAAIRTAFDKGTSLTSGGVTVVMHRTPAIGDGSPSGGWWQVPVKIPFYANQF